jgi:ATP-dependent Clp protease ATP-binding subunit ClpB
MLLFTMPVSRRTNGCPGKPGAAQAHDALKRYARDITEAARTGKLDPVIGWDEEGYRAIQVPARRVQNSRVLTGEPGLRQDRARGGPRALHRKDDVAEAVKD